MLLGAIRHFVISPRYPYSSKQTFAKDAKDYSIPEVEDISDLHAAVGHLSFQPRNSGSLISLR